MNAGRRHDWQCSRRNSDGIDWGADLRFAFRRSVCAEWRPDEDGHAESLLINGWRYVAGSEDTFAPHGFCNAPGRRWAIPSCGKERRPARRIRTWTGISPCADSLVRRATLDFNCRWALRGVRFRQLLWTSVSGVGEHEHDGCRAGRLNLLRGVVPGSETLLPGEHAGRGAGSLVAMVRKQKSRLLFWGRLFACAY